MVQEHGVAGRALPLGAVQGIAPFELLVCASCNYAEWYATAPQALHASPEGAVIELADYRLPCHGCGLNDHLLVAQFLEARRAPLPATQLVTLPGIRLSDDVVTPGGQALATVYSAHVPLAVMHTHGVADGTFALTLCRSCGLGGWYACKFRGLDCEPASEPCPRCKNDDRVHIPTVKEEDGKKLPVFFAWREQGSFQLDVCRTCGFTEWFANLGDLKPGRNGVALLEGGAPRRSPAPERTPYRR